MATIHIYTDGSALGNPGPGGYGIIIEWVGKNYIKEFSRGFKYTTNNRMELTAIIYAMQVPGVTKIITDSDYCFKGCTKWIKGWIRKGWKTSSGADVKNDGLWKKIHDLDPSRIQFEWVKAHDANEHNNHVDKLANNAIGKKDTPEQTKEKLEQELEMLDKRRAEILAKLAQL